MFVTNNPSSYKAAIYAATSGISSQFCPVRSILSEAVSATGVLTELLMRSMKTTSQPYTKN